jgi:hypothetical protein
VLTGSVVLGLSSLNADFLYDVTCPRHPSERYKTVVTNKHEGGSEAAISEDLALPSPPLLGPVMFSALYALVNILKASAEFYLHREELYWLVSPCLLLVGTLVIYRAILVRRDIPKALAILTRSPNAESKKASIELARSLAANFTFGMYGIGSSLLLVSWLSRSHG